MPSIECPIFGLNQGDKIEITDQNGTYTLEVKKLSSEKLDLPEGMEEDWEGTTNPVHCNGKIALNHAQGNTLGYGEVSGPCVGCRSGSTRFIATRTKEPEAV